MVTLNELNKPIIVRSKEHGLLRLGLPTPSDLKAMSELRERDLAAREFTVRILIGQLRPPQIDYNKMVAWPGRLLTHMARKWAREGLHRVLPPGGSPFVAFQELVYSYLDDTTKEMLQTLSAGRTAMLKSVVDANNAASQGATATLTTLAWQHSAGLLFPKPATIDDTLARLFNEESRRQARLVAATVDPMAEWTRATDLSRMLERQLRLYEDAIKGSVVWQPQLERTAYFTDLLSSVRERLIGNLQLPDSLGVADQLLANIQQMLDLTTVASAALATIQPMAIGAVIGLSPKLRSDAWDSFAGFADSYGDLLSAVENNPAMFSPGKILLPRLSGQEFYYGTDLLVSVSLPEEETSQGAEKRAIQDAVSLEVADALEEMLAGLGLDLLPMWRGARESRAGANPDRVRHFTTSLRELFTHVLHRLSPDAEVRAWSTDPDHFDDKRRPTRRARLLFICRGINEGAFAPFLQKDIAAALEFLDLFQGGTHSTATRYSEDQLVILQLRMESTLRFIIETARISRQADA